MRGVSCALAFTAVVLSVSGCGSDEPAIAADRQAGTVTESTSAPTSSSAPAPASASSSTEDVSVVNPGEAVPASEVFTDAPAVAQAFAEQALGDVTVVNSPTVADAVTKISAFLTDRVATEIIGLGDTEGAFRLLPYKYKDLAPGQPATAASVNVDSMAELVDQDPNSVLMEVVATYTWEFGDLGSVTGTRTYELGLLPSTEADELPWRVDWMSGKDDNLREN